MIALAARSPKSALVFCAVFFLTPRFYGFAVARDLFAAEASPFATFNIMIDIDIEDGEIDMTATFSLGADSKGLDLVKDAVSLQVTGGTGAYTVTIPMGGFKTDKRGGFLFQGRIDRVKLAASLRPSRDGGYDFAIETEGANLRGFANPVTVILTIGDDAGKRSVKAKIE